MQESDSLTKEQIEEEIRKIKEAHAEDEGNSAFQISLVYGYYLKVYY